MRTSSTVTTLQVIQTSRIEEPLAQDTNIGTSREALDHGHIPLTQSSQHPSARQSVHCAVDLWWTAINMDILTEKRRRS